MFFTYSRESAVPYFNSLEILKFDIFKLRITEFNYKIINGRSDIPSFFTEFPIPDMLQNLILSDQKSEQITEYTRLNSLQQKFGNLFILISSIHVLLIYIFKNYKNVLLHSQ